MALDIFNKVPEVYRSSRDFRVFLNLLDLTLDDIKYDIDNWLTLYSPMKCPVKFLPYLADMIGYKYNTQLSVTENRIIMTRFVQMIKNKGSDVGIRMAAALSLNAQLASDPESKEYQEAVNQLQYLETYFDKEKGEIIIYYPKELKKVRDLLHYVRPVGTTIRYVPSVMPDTSGVNTGIYTDVSHVVNTYDPEKSSKINHANIGVSPISPSVPKYYYNVSFKLNDSPEIISLAYSAAGESSNTAIEAIDAAHAKAQVKKRYKGSKVQFISCERSKDSNGKAIFVQDLET